MRIRNRASVAAIESLCIAVLRRMSSLDIQQVDVIILSLFLEYSGDELRAIIETYVFGLIVGPDALFQYQNQS